MRAVLRPLQGIEGHFEGIKHRRRMEREEKAKVVASVWGGGGKDFVQFLSALAVLPWSIWKNRMNSTFSSKQTKAKELARQRIEQIMPPKTDVTTFAYASLFIFLLWHWRMIWVPLRESFPAEVLYNICSSNTETKPFFLVY